MFLRFCLQKKVNAARAVRDRAPAPPPRVVSAAARCARGSRPPPPCSGTLRRAAMLRSGRPTYAGSQRVGPLAWRAGCRGRAKTHPPPASPLHPAPPAGPRHRRARRPSPQSRHRRQLRSTARGRGRQRARGTTRARKATTPTAHAPTSTAASRPLVSCPPPRAPPTRPSLPPLIERGRRLLIARRRRAASQWGASALPGRPMRRRRASRSFLSPGQARGGASTSAYVPAQAPSCSAPTAPASWRRSASTPPPPPPKYCPI
ncbi:hypothetical protein T492DRAFT_1002866 [Pavlovales sp. CCMP2436]|nr:hypothetical protein T492DRAFT_1002866 [Pavlovales sp. CCMP2436]|mmetsp:Transcript_821/g.2154  ORF Transcript_821/g.2154 Transcript_821/m.2154 type:complete len:261 (-) Transcript_821:141-923(-)